MTDLVDLHLVSVLVVEPPIRRFDRSDRSLGQRINEHMGSLRVKLYRVSGRRALNVRSTLHLPQL